MQPSYTHTGETKTENTHISAYLQIIREDSALQQSYLHYLFYSSTKWLGEPMHSELHVFISLFLQKSITWLMRHTLKNPRGQKKKPRDR